MPPGAGPAGSLDSPRRWIQLAALSAIPTVDGISVKFISAPAHDPHRLGALALALLQFGVFAALPAADAVLEARGWATDTHIESEGGESCEAGHSHLLCQLTRSLSSGISPLIPIDLPLVSAATTNTPTATAWHNRPIPPGGGGPRAPPRV